jgi:lambda repressor-like predicted transcriptional regulator
MDSRTQIMNSTYKPSTLIQEVRAGFVLQGTSLTEFCREQGLDRRHVHSALSGRWKGPKANALAQKVFAASRGDDA